MGDEDEIPRSLRLLWGLAEPPRRGPRPALRLKRIVAAAIKIADAEGIHALSMARLAEQLGCAPMSLYRHVASKEELQVFMMDTAPGKPPVIDLPAREWRAGLERWARALQAVYYRHPWILQITTGRPPLEPGQLAWLECGLRTVRGTGLGAAQKLSVVLTVVHYVRGAAQVTAVMLEALKRSDADNQKRQDWYERTLARLVGAERYPALAELIASGLFAAGGEDADESADFDFGLARILDGIDRLVAGRATPAAPGGGSTPRG